MQNRNIIPSGLRLLDLTVYMIGQYAWSMKKFPIPDIKSLL